ncbi:DASH family cryptochrome [Limnothrix sp. FACHB-1083]|uniref:DASH family cryptochrome n=1 Tax=unclassified Limnothrix TaxID=2632864 RepID=UPI001680C585|nr:MULTISPECIES: DASH family cryptochrome [unclassified Limnothrix]MBD2162306.1 DASH family cryptochrome [Limnothrix sp. FACHB-1083]MBD2193278.1 DASH family cryptochrome [Limnothrix sp. FACHB-1088]
MAAAPPSASCAIVWFRTDLRLHDHEPLLAAAENHKTLIPVYCFDPRQFAETAFGFPKTGPFRAQFLLESVADLRAALRAKGSDLIVRSGLPEVVLPALAAEYGAQAIYYHEEVGTEEQAVELALEAALKAPEAPRPVQENIQSKVYWGHTLYHPDNLPFEIGQIPELFTEFRKTVEARSTIDPPLPPPDRLPPVPPGLNPGELPRLADWGLVEPEPSPLALISFTGGEQAGFQRLQEYIWDGDHLRVYKQTRNGMLRPNDASKFSPWLALGCLSPRKIWDEVQAYEQKVIRNESTYWLIFELLWRDYFRWIVAKHRHRVFRVTGLQGITIPWRRDAAAFAAWCDGQTGYPLVDANMRELRATGFMSNRGRQNVASFLTKNLGIDWRMGAEWFESWLIDYDVCSNWGNWNYTAGVGNDARGFRFFNILKQAKDYDPQGEYVKHWLPELRQLPAGKVHHPWTLLPVEQERFGVQIGRDYPGAIVDLFESAAENEALYNRAIGKGVAGRSKPAHRGSRRDRPRRP